LCVTDLRRGVWASRASCGSRRRRLVHRQDQRDRQQRARGQDDKGEAVAVGHVVRPAGKDRASQLAERCDGEGESLDRAKGS